HLADRGVAADAHLEVAFGALLEETKGQRNQVVKKAQSHLGVEFGSKMEQQLRAQDRSKPAEYDNADQAGAQQMQQPRVAARDDSINQRPCQQGQSEREQLQKRRDHGDSAPQSRLSQKLPHVTPHDVPTLAGLPELFSRAECQRDARKRAVELI